MMKRVVRYGVIAIALVIINFFIPRLLPGSPVRTLIGEDVAKMTAEEKMGILDAYRLNDPLLNQFGYYMRDLLTGNYGVSFSKRLPIRELLKPAIIWTALLSTVTLVFSALAGCFLGACSALRRREQKDLSFLLGTTLLSSIPPFWIALLLIAVFGAKLHLFPIYGAYSLWEKYSGLARILDILHHLVLPVTALVVTSLMPYFSTTRYSFLKTINEDYVKMAKIRGLPSRKINLCYIMRNTLIPVFTMIMMDMGYLLSGSVLIETVFSYPGLGVLMQHAVFARDYPLIQYTFLFSSLLTIAALFIADIFYHFLNPTLGKQSDYEAGIEK
jgi:peptide/nickel transport system permease protein